MIDAEKRFGPLLAASVLACFAQEGPPRKRLRIEALLNGCRLACCRRRWRTGGAVVGGRKGPGRHIKSKVFPTSS